MSWTQSEAVVEIYRFGWMASDTFERAVNFWHGTSLLERVTKLEDWQIVKEPSC